MTCCNGKKSGWIGVVFLVLLGVWIARAHHHRRLVRTEAPGPLIGFPAEVSSPEQSIRPPAVPQPPRVHTPVVRAPEFTEAAGVSSLAHWPPEPGDGFDADVELSPRAALQSAARQAARFVCCTCTDPAKVTEISVSTDAGEEQMPDVIRAFQPVVADSTKLTYVAGGMPATVRASEDHLWLTLRTIDASPAHAKWFPSPLKRGSVEASMIGPTGVRRVEVRFEEKPWAEDLSTFAAADRTRLWIVGHSDRPCATREEASRAARADAARQLASLVQGRLPGGRGVGRPLGDRADAALAGERFVADRLTRRFHREYGDVWHEAILVDASPANLQALADETAGLVRARRASFIARVASGAAMVAVIFIVYVVVNAFTKGYFVWRLRAATALILVVALGALLLLAAVG
jgi:hypothetical protein